MAPGLIVRSLHDYVNLGVPTGGFLRAVLGNDLREAFGRADIHNRHAMFDIVSYIWNNLPAACWGSYEKVDAWLKKKNDERENT